MRRLATILLLALPIVGMAEQMTAYPPAPANTAQAEHAEQAKWAGAKELVGYLPKTVIDRLGTVKVPVTRNPFGEVISVSLSSDICRGAPLRCKGEGFASDAEYVDAFRILNAGIVQGDIYRRGNWSIPVRKAEATNAVSEAQASKQVAQVSKANNAKTTKPVSAPKVAPNGGKREKVSTRVAPKPSKKQSNRATWASCESKALREGRRGTECGTTAPVKSAKGMQPVANKPAEKPTTKPVAQKADTRPAVAKTAQEAVRVLTEKSGTTLSPENLEGGCNTRNIQSDSKCWAGVKGTSAKVDLTPTAAKEMSTALNKAKTTSS